jgi:hypothetical protein
LWNKFHCVIKLVIHTRRNLKPLEFAEFRGFFESGADIDPGCVDVDQRAQRLALFTQFSGISKEI